MSGKVIYQIILCWFWNFRIGLALPGEKVMDIMDLFYMEYSVGMARERFWELLERGIIHVLGYEMIAVR